MIWFIALKANDYFIKHLRDITRLKEELLILLRIFHVANYVYSWWPVEP